MMSEGDKERIKSHASFANSVGVAFIALAGLAALLQYAAREGERDWWPTVVIAFIAISAGTVLHEYALHVLTGLDKQKPIGRSLIIMLLSRLGRRRAR